ncbi:MAG TPA: competence protein ComJ [Moraxellaceae bacterium]|jgi:hypothetical protein|nr:competence protein ComJ [Moraxellaceae bacterium]
MQCKLDLEISHSQFGLRSRAVDDDELEWGEGNLQQGLMWQPGLVLLDPLSDETFGADVVVRTVEKFLPSKGAQRTVQVPFEIIDTAELFAFSPCEELPAKLDVEVGDYTLIYEVCLGTEVYYVLTLLKGKIDTATALKTDGWGLVKDQALTAGVF